MVPRCLLDCMLSHSVVFNSVWPHGLQYTRLLCSWNFPCKKTGVGCHFLLQSSGLGLDNWAWWTLPTPSWPNSLGQILIQILLVSFISTLLPLKILRNLQFPQTRPGSQISEPYGSPDLEWSCLTPPMPNLSSFLENQSAPFFCSWDMWGCLSDLPHSSQST